MQMSGFTKAVLVAAVTGAAQAITSYQMTGGMDPIAMCVAALVGSVSGVAAFLLKSPLDK